MKTTRVGGGHPGYRVLGDAGPAMGKAAREFLYNRISGITRFAKMVDACVMHGIKPFYGPFGDIADAEGCEQQFRNAYLMGCVGAWSLHPSQIAIAKRVFSPDVEEVKFALRILAAMPDGAGVAMLDGKMQDDATWKQAKVIVDLAKLVAATRAGDGEGVWDLRHELRWLRVRNDHYTQPLKPNWSTHHESS